MAAIGQYAGEGLLAMAFGPAIACVRTAISIGGAATTINIGSVATGGASGNADTTPPSNSLVVIVHPGSSTTQNLPQAISAFTITSSTATAMTLPASTVASCALSVGDFVFLLGINTATTVTTAPSIPIFLNTLYIGLSTQAWSTTVTDAQLLAGEPTSSGNYSRVAQLNSGGAGGVATTFWGNPTTSSEIETVANLIALTFATSNAAWSTTTTPLASWFAADLVTLDAGHTMWSGALTPATDIVNGTGVTFSFAAAALKVTIQ